MMRNEPEKCYKCEKKFTRHEVDYNDYHDGGVYEDSYLRIDRNECKLVDGNWFYCNECYDDIGNTVIQDAIESGKSFIKKELKEAYRQLEEDYNKKIDDLNNVYSYILDCIEMLDEKESYRDLTKEEAESILKYVSVYNATYRPVEVGYPVFKTRSELKELRKDI